jgi:ATP-dependent protease ClpP protease subunit
MPKIVISGTIGWDVLAADIKKEFADLKPNDEVDIEINSPGGSVFEGIEIANAIKAHKGKTNIIITSFAASMGSYIAMSGDSIKAYEDATFMIHNASTIEWGDHHVLRKAANVVESLTGLISKAYEKQTGQSNTEIRELMNNETWLFGDEILNAGFVDEIIEAEKPETKEEAVAFQKLVFQDCIKKMNDEEKTKTDLDKVAAYFENQTKSNSQPNQGKINQSQEEKKMNEKEFLAFLGKNPDALAAYEKIIAESKTEIENLSLSDYLEKSESGKTEYDAAIENAKADASTEIEAGKISKADAKFAAKVMQTYGSSVQEVATDFICGESDIKTLKMVVAISDENKENIKSLQIQNGQPPATPATGISTKEQEKIGKTKANAQALSDAINNSNKVQ